MPYMKAKKMKKINLSPEDLQALMEEVGEELEFVMMRVIFGQSEVYEIKVVLGAEFTQLYSPSLDRTFHATYVGRAPDGTRYVKYAIEFDTSYDAEWLKSELREAGWKKTELLLS